MRAEVVIVGGGIAGASLAHFLGEIGVGPIVLLEKESAPGYHATGRSAALFTETYGPEQVRALTRASRAFYTHPPEGFTEQDVTHSPTLIETQLDSIALQLYRIKSKVQSESLLEHLTNVERRVLTLVAA